MTPERLQRIRRVLQCRQPDLTVVADRVEKGHNLSAIIRSCDAFGLAEVHAVSDSRYRLHAGKSMGSHRWVNVQRYAEAGSALAGLREDGYQILAAQPSPEAVHFRDVDYTVPTAIVVGAEKEGLSPEVLGMADRLVCVPLVGMVESLNVSVATAVILAEAQRQREAAGFFKACRLDEDTYDTLFFQWAHPTVAAYCDERGLDYPAVGDDGEIRDPAGWYNALPA